MSRTAAFASVLLALFVTACADTPEAGVDLSTLGEAAALTSPGGQSAAMVPSGLLPAYRLPRERAGGGKGDALDDFRRDNPAWYAITASSRRDARAMAEWEPMQALALAYPDYVALDSAVRQTMVDIVANASVYANVFVVYQSASMRQDLEERLLSAGLSSRLIASRIRFFRIPVDSVWFMDYGPLPIVDRASGDIALLDFRYYDPRVLDDAVPTRLGAALGTTTYRMPYQFEGGNLQADGAGVCYTTARAFANGGSEEELGLLLRYYAGCEELVVLRDIQSDGTGHIDMFFKLVAPDEAIVGEFTESQDEQAKVDMDWNAALLTQRGLTVHRMPMPAAAPSNFGIVPRTYLNSTLVNGPRGRVNLWPVYAGDEATRDAARAVWQSVLPDWDHIEIPADQLALLSGAIHCVTRTLPAGDFTAWVADGTCTGGRCDAPDGGYSGACASSDDCRGPAWLCGTNDCAFDRGERCGDALCVSGETCFQGRCVSGCGLVPSEGCCDGAVVWRCDSVSGKLTSVGCAMDGAVCSWSLSKESYACAPFDAGDDSAADDSVEDDPGGDHPRSCAVYSYAVYDELECVGDADCDDGDACTVDVCVDGACLATPVVCPETTSCFLGMCFEGCHGISPIGCCDGAVAVWCDQLSGQLQARDCGEIAQAPICTWVGGDDGYFCAAEDGGLDPEGTPLACDGYVGCAGDSECRDADDCTEDVCVDGACSHRHIDGCVCQPQCGDRECGLDPVCGVSCGACDEGYDCVEGACVVDIAAYCDTVGPDGCCAGDSLFWCEEGEMRSFDCTERPAPNNRCGWNEEGGFFDCGAGAAPPADVEGLCPWAPAPCATEADCDDSDPCTADACADGFCEQSPIDGCCHEVADCNDENPCTDDDCQGNVCHHSVVSGCVCTAAACDDGDVCTVDGCDDAGLCTHGHEPGCCNEALECGDDDVCTEDICVDHGCQHTDIVDCARPCASDADCADDDPCTSEVCGQGGTCQVNHIPGCCVADSDCDDHDNCTVDSCDVDHCAATPVVCEGADQCNPRTGACEPPCVPDCRNKACGDNGCGGVCGSCEPGYACDDRGICREQCSCIGVECGAPEAGCPSCGECAADEVCNVMFQCVPGAAPADSHVAPEPDVMGAEDVTSAPGGGGGGGGGGGCAVSPVSSGPLGLMTLLALLALLGGGILRRRSGSPSGIRWDGR